MQHDCSDWDFIVTRANANGRLVLTRGAELSVKAPALGRAVAELQYGATLLELDAEVDARLQAEAVQAASWNAADQALQLDDASAPAFRSTGNFDPDALASGAGSPALRLVHSALDAAEATAWANATWQQRRVDLASGRAKCIGIATVRPGDTVHASVTVKDLVPEKRRVTLSTICTVNGKVVIDGEALVMPTSRETRGG